MSLMQRGVVLALAAVLAPGAMAQTLKSYASPLKDISLKSRIVERDMDALKKISKEFAQSYRFGSSTLYYKEPNKMRLESKVGVINARYIINGNAKTLKAGVINKRWDITRKPGQRQTVMTVGLLTPAWADLVDATSHGATRIDGQAVVVFETHFKDEPRGTWSKLFIDPARRVLVRQEQYHGDGKLKVVYRFLDPVSVGGVWVPSGIEVYNAAGQKGATTRVENVKVNTGLADSLFKL